VLLLLLGIVSLFTAVHWLFTRVYYSLPSNQCTLEHLLPINTTFNTTFNTFNTFKMDYEDDEYEDEEMEMPTLRLKDVVNNLETKQPSVLNLDACFPPNTPHLLKYILDKIPQSVTTLSLRFNDIKDEGALILSEWLSENETVEILYMMGVTLSNSSKTQIENAFKKNLVGHRQDNNGNTFIRCVKPPPVEEPPA
jgi:hypothetical protein